MHRLFVIRKLVENLPGITSPSGDFDGNTAQASRGSVCVGLRLKSQSYIECLAGLFSWGGIVTVLAMRDGDFVEDTSIEI